jgi:hypothetical protein
MFTCRGAIHSDSAVRQAGGKFMRAAYFIRIIRVKQEN